MSSQLPPGWASANLPDLIGCDGLIIDGDWVESKDQDPDGTIRLTQLADIGDGQFRDRSKRFLRQDQADRLDVTFLREGDVLVARMPDPLGRACLYPGGPRPAVTVVDVCIIRPGDNVSGVSTRWLVHFINAPQFRMAVAGEQRGSTRKRISKKSLCDLELPLPPPGEQARIADDVDSYLTRLDYAVASLQRVQAKLKAYRASVLKAAVEGRLVPTEASVARAEKRDYESADAMLAGILKERRRRWERAELAKLKAKSGAPKNDKWKTKYEEPAAPDVSGLPELPEGWCWTSLGQAFVVTVGATPSRSVPEYWGGGIPWVSSGEVAFCRINDTTESITTAGLENSSTRMNPRGSVLVGMIGEGKTRGQAAILDIDACGNQNAAAIWVPLTDVPPEYVYHYLVQQYETTRRRGSGNNQPALNKTRVEAIPLPLPPLDEQRRIVERLEVDLTTIASSEATVERELMRIYRLRQAVLKWAFEGKLVDQNPNDEPAEKLLARIAAERASVAALKRNGRKARGAE